MPLDFTVTVRVYATMAVTLGLDSGEDVTFSLPYDEETYDEYRRLVGVQRVTYNEARDGLVVRKQHGHLKGIERF